MPKETSAHRFTICLAIADPLRSSKLETILGEDGYDVIPFRTAKELWDNFEWRRPHYIITDRKFTHEFSGLDLCREVRRRYMLPYVYIHILSAKITIAEIEEALDAGANDYSIIPVSPFQVRVRVRVGLRWLQYINSITGAKTPPSGVA